MPDVSPSHLMECPLCDEWIDPASLDEVIFHGSGSCTVPGTEKPRTGIRGFEADEPPQG